jgi:cbb3-type cytochrome oxidase subunit 3
LGGDGNTEYIAAFRKGGKEEFDRAQIKTLAEQQTERGSKI